MASGLVFDYNGTKTDLEELVEISRNTNADHPRPFDPNYKTNLGNTGLGFYGGTTASLLSKNDSPFGSGIVLPPEFRSNRGVCPLLMEKGTRPRITSTKLNYRVSGASQRYYYYVSRTETTLYLFRSSQINTGYSILDSFPVSKFPQSGIPKYLYIELVGGGGGGAGGVWSSFAWVSSEFSYGGCGGNGGGIVYTYIPVGPYRSNYSVRSTTTDYCITIHKGGGGSGPKGFNKRGDAWGYDGTDSIVYFPNGTDIYNKAIGGNGGNGYPEHNSVQVQPSYASTLVKINGGVGRYKAGGSSVSTPDVKLYHERMRNYWTTVSGGSSLGNTKDGGGGGASRGQGGNGGGYSITAGGTRLLTGGGGKIGGGGGGGHGEFTNSGSGGNGGYGSFCLMY